MGSKFFIYVARRAQKPSRGVREVFLLVFENELNIGCSKHWLFTDFRTVSGGPGASKMWFSLRSGSNFHIFAYLKISTLLNVQKHGFRPRFGGPSWHRKCTSWPREANMSEKNFFFWGSKSDQKSNSTSRAS